MKIAAVQLALTDSLEQNAAQIREQILIAAEHGAALVVFQEAVMSGYPPVERCDVAGINFELQQRLLHELLLVAEANSIAMILGVIRKGPAGYENSLAMYSPGMPVKYYNKRALWGWDADNFVAGENSDGIFSLGDFRIGVRICFEVRFPEYFRELYTQRVDLIVVSFCDQAVLENPSRYDLIKAHLQTRAVENCCPLVAVNGVTFAQTAPTCVISADGLILAEAIPHQPQILYFDIPRGEDHFGRQGRRHFSDLLTGL